MEAAHFEREQKAQQEVKKPVEEAAEPGNERLELASAIGNQGVQRVATSPELQRSPAAAGLLGQGQIARASMVEGQEQEQEEEKGGAENAPATQEAEGTENAPATPAGEGATENAPATPEGEKGPEAGGQEPAQATQEAPPAGAAESAAPAGPEAEEEKE